MISTPLYRAMRKYGFHNFSIRQIDECDENLLNERQHYWIQHYNTLETNGEGYNPKEDSSLIEIKKEEPIVIPEVKKAKRKPCGFILKEKRGDGKKRSVSVMGINIETGEEKIWSSFTDAALEVAGNKKANATIQQAVKNGTKAYGYRWKRIGQNSSKIPIKGVHKRTWEEIYFESIIEAARFFGTENTSAIRQSLQHPHKRSYRKFYWFYA